MARAASLLNAEPVLAAEQALEILKVMPGYLPAELLLASAHRRSGNPGALAALERLVRMQPNWAAAHFERALVLAGVDRGDEAIAALREVVRLNPQHTEAWRVLADHLMAIGDSEGGDAAYVRHIQSSTHNPHLQQAAAAMVANDIPLAERLLKSYLQQAPTDVPAIRMLAEVAVRCGHVEDAENLLVRCLELAPTFAAARYNYAVLLHRGNKSSEALVEIERLLALEPRNPSYRNLCAVILSRVGEYVRSSQIYDQLLQEYPANSKVWLSYGHVLKTQGRQEECVDAYRKSIALDPIFGEAYWSLANLKTFRFTSADLVAMHARLGDARLDEANRVQFHFAMGKAYEDAGDYARSFEHYAKGNARQRAVIRYDAELNSARSRRLEKILDREFFQARAGSGHSARDPIFIVGMPRSGSTLLEQILSTHSAVEGTTELPEILSMARALRERAESDDIDAYGKVLASLSTDVLRQLGEQYLQRTRIHRKTDRPFFIDKMPNNFLHIGMIQLILPNARIIDARRHPLGCCLSNFKQYFARGQRFSYGLTDMGRFYRDYVQLMAHFDVVLPGRIHRVNYERMVEDTEPQVRALLDYCGLPFEPGCLRFFENARPVRTASAEQVRQPIYREGLEQWRHYEAWLDPLKVALGPVLEHYPGVPDFQLPACGQHMASPPLLR
jgi:tetratricopeptide (TPR) repeat protein